MDMENYQKEISSIWQEFVNGNFCNLEKVRTDILTSWQRCLGNINPFQKKCSLILSNTELDNLCYANKELLETSTPVMADLYKFVQGSGFIIILSDAYGYLLKTIGDPNILSAVEKNNFIPGSNWAEKIMGTNAIGTSIVIDKPLQVFAAEHWCRSVHTAVCSCAPIHDPDSGQIIGALDMSSSDFMKVHSHTLGMAVAAVKSIESQIAAKRNLKLVQHGDQYKTLIMESISEGLLIIDNFGIITHINQRAIDFLSFQKNVLGENIYTVLQNRFGRQENYEGLLSILNSKEKTDSEFVAIHTESGLIKLTIISRFLYEDNKATGKIITIQETAKIKKIINRIAGNRARVFFKDIIGKNKEFLECVQIAEKVAKGVSNVLIIGESGTGKDMFAQAIHNASLRCNEPYIAINCAAIPRDLIGSELFGYTDGAFTGAKRGGNPGKFELADQGTIFLDEIGEMPLDMQTSLLRALEERTFTRIGGGTPIHVNVRIIAATSRDLVKEVSLGNFRSDLYYRLNVITINLPPLRERRDDVPVLIEYLTNKVALFMGKNIKQVAPNFIELCLSYDWPGNVRELQNIIEKAINLTNEPIISIHSVPTDSFINFKNKDILRGIGCKNTLNKIKEDIENEQIRLALAKHGENKYSAAKELGIARSSLYRKLKKMNN